VSGEPCLTRSMTRTLASNCLKVCVCVCVCVWVGGWVGGWVGVGGCGCLLYISTSFCSLLPGSLGSRWACSLPPFCNRGGAHTFRRSPRVCNHVIRAQHSSAKARGRASLDPGKDLSFFLTHSLFITKPSWFHELTNRTWTESSTFFRLHSLSFRAWNKRTRVWTNTTSG